MDKQETPRYEVRPVTESDIVKQEDFGTFRIIKTPWNIIYTNYVGYTVMTAPYTTTPQGRSGKLSLYEWLEYVLNSKEEFLSRKDEILNELGITYGEWLEHMKEMTEAVMTKPCVVFTDLDYAVKEATEHIKWLESKSKELMEAMSTPVTEESEDDVKKNAEHDAEAIATENFLETLKEEGHETD